MNLSAHSLAGDLVSYRLAIAWLMLVMAVSIHVFDEAKTGFLAVYNPTVSRIRTKFRWSWPPVFSTRVWLTRLVVAIAISFLLTPLAFHFPRTFRPLATLAAIAMLLNGVSHLAGTILGHTFSDIRFPRPMPGTYSSPILIAASIYVLSVVNGMD